MTHDNAHFNLELQPTSGDLLLIRHGITDMAGTLCGQNNPPLNSSGRKQAEALASQMRHAPVSRLYSSDLQRAVQTALPLAQAWNIGVIPHKDLREISFGDWEGRRWADIRAGLPNCRNVDSLPELEAPRGETFAAFRDRVLRAFQDIITDSSGVSIAVVTHLGVIRVVLNELFRSNPFWIPDKRIDCCAVHQVRMREGFVEPVSCPK